MLPLFLLPARSSRCLSCAPAPTHNTPTWLCVTSRLKYSQAVGPDPSAGGSGSRGGARSSRSWGGRCGLWGAAKMLVTLQTWGRGGAGEGGRGTGYQ